MITRIKKYWLLLSVVFMTGCATTLVVTELTDGVHATQLYSLEELIKPTGDADYALITDEWWENELLPYLRKRAFEDKLVYTNRWDCNRYADWGYVEARKLYAKSDSKFQAPAFGYMEYKTDMGPWHAICFYVNDSGFLVFVEPQFFNHNLATQSPKDVKVSVGDKQYPMLEIYPRSTMANPVVNLSEAEFASIRQYRL